MALCRKEIVVRSNRAKFARVICRRDTVRADGQRIAVYKVKPTAAVDAVQQRMVRVFRNLAPTHIGYRCFFTGRQQRGISRNHAKATRAVFGRTGGEQLHAEANTENWLLQGWNQFNQSVRTQARHRIRCSAHSRQDYALSGADNIVIRRQYTSDAQAL